VFLTGDHKHIKLGDFGFASPWRRDRKLDTCAGSFPYVAPEVLGARPYVGPEADAWSCGAVLLTMLTACIPFAAPSKEETRDKLERGEFALPAYVSKRAADLISRLLNPDQTRRCTIDDALRHPWLQQKIASTRAVKLLSRARRTSSALATSAPELRRTKAWASKNSFCSLSLRQLPVR
jgi:5'-AMP-activated protein kinase catalytic alpha subunit